MKVLVVDDGSGLAAALIASLELAGHEVATTGADMTLELSRGQVSAYQGFVTHTSVIDGKEYAIRDCSVSFNRIGGGRRVAQWKRETRGRSRR